jgi:hypothetical protein
MAQGRTAARVAAAAWREPNADAGGWGRLKIGKIGNIFLQNACIFTLIP